MNGSDRIGKWKDLYKLYLLSSPLCKKSLGMNILDTYNTIGEIVSLSKKACFFSNEDTIVQISLFSNIELLNK